MNLPSHYLTSQSQIKLTLFGLCVGPIMLIIGACVSLEALYCQAKWEAVPAKVTRAEVSRVHSSRGRRNRSSCHFDYAYKLNGQRFTGSSVDHGLLSLVLPISSRAAISKFPRGSDITVYYDPNMPQRSVLWNSVPWEGPVVILLGGMFFVGAFFSLQELKGIKATPKTEETYAQKQVPQIPTKVDDEQEREDAIKQWRENLKQQSV